MLNYNILITVSLIYTIKQIIITVNVVVLYNENKQCIIHKVDIIIMSNNENS